MREQPPVILVHLRRPMRKKQEMRSDPFFEFGSFGCTRCHSRNLMNPRKADRLVGVRLGFAQGGDDGFKLVLLTPPISIRRHADRCEAVWEPTKVFRYSDAPTLINNCEHSDFSLLQGKLKGVNRETWCASFSSAYRTRCKPLDADVAKEVIRVYEKKARAAAKHQWAQRYCDALPYDPPLIDPNRRATYERCLREARAAQNRRCVTPKSGKDCRPKKPRRSC